MFKLIQLTGSVLLGILSVAGMHALIVYPFNWGLLFIEVGCVLGTIGLFRIAFKLG